MSDITYVQSVSIGALQGVSELFPVSSLGHSVLVPALLGGSWKHLVTEEATSNSGQSPYLAFVVALHVATALALIIYFRSDWVRIVKGLFSSAQARKITTPDQRLGWLLVIATIPVGILGLALEHKVRTLFAKPLAAAIFLTINGVILLASEYLSRREAQSTTSLDTLSFKEAGAIGTFQTFALLAGISRSGITMVGGLLRGLSREDAVRFSFLLATPVILAAGLLKIPTLFGSAGAHIHGQVIAGAVTAFVAAYISVKFLTRYFETRTLTPFGLYCLFAGAGCTIRFGFF